MRKQLIALARRSAFAIVLAASAFGVWNAKNIHAADFFWDADGNSKLATGGTGNWDTGASIWRAGSDTGTLVPWTNAGSNNDAFLAGTAGTLTLTSGISVNDITVNPSPAGTYTIAGAAQTLTLNGASQSVIDVASGNTLAVTSGQSGTNGFTKSSVGTLILDGTLGSNGLFGPINVNGGTLQAGSATNNAANQVLRSNSVNLSGSTSLTTVGTTIDLRVGSLSGSGAVTPATGGAVNVLSLADSTFSGTVTTTGGLNLRGGNGTTQTFNGNVTGLTGTIGINSGASVRLTGTGDSTSGVIGPNTGTTTTVALRGGTFAMDNSGGNTSATNGRLSDGNAFTFLGGTLSLIGHIAGTTETVGAYAMNSGSATVSVTNNGGTGTALTFTDSGSLRDSTAGTVNFVGLGTGTLGAAGNAPRITFSGAINANTVNGALTSSASSATSVTYGWARVNGTSWAGNAANGIFALSETARNSATLASAAANEITTFTPSATTTTLTADLGTAATSLLLKITPSASGQTLAVGTNAINRSALMLAGTTDFTISGTGALFGTVSSTRYVYVTEANTVLNTSQSFAGSNQPFVKSGAGTVNLNGVANQLGFTTNQNVNLAEGTLRGTLTSLGGGASTDGDFTTINLRGGTLEISGGGNFSRAVDLTGTTSGGGLSFDGGGTNRGDGGFSAIGGDANVTLVTTIGGSTASNLVWDDGVFLSNGYALTMGSTKADSRVDITNNIGLDNTSVSGGAANNYFAREIRVSDNSGSATDVARLSGIISGSTNADLLKTGAGVLELSNTNTYAGNTLIQQGTLVATNGSALSDTGSVILSNTAGATLQLNSNETIGALSGGGTAGGNVSLQSNTLTVGDQRDSTFAGVINGVNGSLNKQGVGSLVLTNSNTYTGTTTISNGTLLVNNTIGSGTGTGAVTVQTGAVLGGSGSIAGNTTFQSGSTHSPGNSPAIQTFSSDLTYSSGSTFVWELLSSGNATIDRGVEYDGVNVGGLMTTEANVNANLVFNSVGSTVDWTNAFWNTDKTWLVFQNTIAPSLDTNGSVNDALGYAFLPASISNDINNVSLTSARPGSSFVWQQIGAGNDLFLHYNFTAVPEPASLGGAMVLLGSWAMHRSRRKKAGIAGFVES
ncbi:MAG: autotransporter-associated beta strand repeat-containing protein [Pirellulaceae bacterium]|nr:autotransporter-associated beta strand repeat-containing protein [Pirellulaceae bacterium]